MSRIVYVNGKYVPEEQGNVSIFDRGFLFADGVYEVTAIVHGRLIDYDPHMERLARSLAEISMAWPCSKAELRRMHEELISRNRLDQGWVYMQVTRGAADRDFKFPKSLSLLRWVTLFPSASASCSPREKWKRSSHFLTGMRLESWASPKVCRCSRGGSMFRLLPCQTDLSHTKPQKTSLRKFSRCSGRRASTASRRSFCFYNLSR